MVGHVQQAPNPGDYFTGSMADINYVIVRGDDGQLRAFHNVCRHKAAPVAEGAGCVKMFECMYHGWQFGAPAWAPAASCWHRLKGTLLLRKAQAPQSAPWRYFLVWPCAQPPFSQGMSNEGRM
jgi:choline monooxygenase